MPDPTPDYDASIPDSYIPDACVDTLKISTQFVVNTIYGDGVSSLDALLNHTNGFILAVNGWNTIKAAEEFGGVIVFKNGVQSAAWSMDYTGQDENLLDGDVGQFLRVGGAVQQSIFELGSDGSVFLYVLPDDTTQHPYMDLRCYGAAFEQDVDGYPILQSTILSGCSVVFFDFRPGAQKNIVADGNVTFELAYETCTP